MIRNDKLQGFVERVNGSRRPITADIFLTEYCNNSCEYCRYKNIRSGKFMSFDEFKNIAVRLLKLGVRGFILTGGGEPTINPHFERICAWMDRRGMNYGVNTNMNVLRLVRPNFLKVSIDSGDKDEYKRIRGVDTLDKVLGNLREYVEWKRKNKVRTVIGVQCVALSEMQAKSFYDAVRGIGVDYIQFRPKEAVDGDVDYSDVLRWLDSVEDERIAKSFKFDMMDYRPRTCSGNWSVITVDANGNVPYCCHRPNEIIGSVFDHDILSRLSEYKPDMDRCERPCRLSGANMFMDNRKEERDIYFV